MIRLFSEEVETTSTNSDHNILYVKSFEEAFFGVYEIEINGNTFIAEKVGEYNAHPVISVPIVEANGAKSIASFVLMKGEQKVCWTGEEGLINESVVEEIPEPVFESEPFEPELVREDFFEKSVVKEPVKKFIEPIIEKIVEPVKQPKQPLDVDYTNLDTLYVESYNELHFGIYEFVFDGKQVLAEQIDRIGNAPLVKVETTRPDGTVADIAFILKTGNEKPVIKENTKRDSIAESLLKNKFVKEDVNIVEEVLEQIKPEPVEVDYDNLETLYVEDYSEVHFGVYEFNIDGKVIIAEQIDTIGGDPLVKITVDKSNGKQADTAFILKKGSGLKNSEITELLAPISDTISESILVDNFDKSERFKALASTLIENVESIRESNTSLHNKLEKNTNESISSIQADLLNRLSDFQVESQIELNAQKKEQEKITNAFNLLESSSNKSNIDSSRALSRVEELRKEIEEATAELNRIAEEAKIAEGRALNEEADLNRISTRVEELTKENDELKKVIKESADASEKNVNKALSRLGTVKKELVEEISDSKDRVEEINKKLESDTNRLAEEISVSKDGFDVIKEELATSIEKAEERVKLYYHEKIKLAESTIFDNIRREEILEAIMDSKAVILAELNDSNGLKSQLRELANEAAKGNYDPIDGKKFQNQLKKDLNKQFATEMQNIRRMMEMYSGGGSTAVQFANGGTMNGDLNVTGTILSGGVDISSLFGSGGGGPGGGISPGDNVSLLTNDAEYVTADELGPDGDDEYFSELTYVSGDLTTIEYYDSPAKTTLLFTKTLTYTGGNLTRSVLTNNITLSSVTKDLTYDGNGNLINITKS